MVGGKKSTNTIISIKDLTKISLAEFLRYYEQPISEEQAWAICFQACCKMRQILVQGLDSVFQTIILDVDNLYIHFDGSVSFTLQHDFDNHINPQPSDTLDDKLTELLGKLIYKALDWGIESDMERELSETLEKLISFMLKLNTETTRTAVVFQDVIKICEDHCPKPSEAASNYTEICKGLFAEYVELQKLLFTIQSCKEYLGTMDVESSCTIQTANGWADLWQDVLGDLQKGVRLHKAMKRPLQNTPREESNHSSYSTVVDDIRNKRYALNKVSARKLKERPCQELSLHDQLMMEVKNPPKLQPSFLKRRSEKNKEDVQKSLDSPCDGIFSDQTISTIEFSKAKKPRLNGIQTDPELKLLSTYNQKPTKQSFPTIADLMGTRYSEIKDSYQRGSYSISSRAQVCFVCHNQYFIWPYMCHLCSSVTCKDCCIKMSMPVRPCVCLPLNFFEVLHLGKEEDLALQDQKATQLLYEVEHWDSSRAPLVFEPQGLSLPLAARTKSMMDWPSMEICTKCEQCLLEILSQQPCRKRPSSWTEL